MPRRDLYHDLVVQALQAEGWTITHDPLHLAYGGRNLYVDLGAEYPIGAEKAGRKIAVEIKSFLGESDLYELGNSVGQYRLYCCTAMFCSSWSRIVNPTSPFPPMPIEAFFKNRLGN